MCNKLTSIVTAGHVNKKCFIKYEVKIEKGIK